MGSYEDELDRIKKKKIQLIFIDSIRFMASSLDSLARNLVGLNGMMCNQCKSETELCHIDESYVAQGMCEKCRGVTYHKLGIDPIFGNLRASHTDE